MLIIYRYNLFININHLFIDKKMKNTDKIVSKVIISTFLRQLLFWLIVFNFFRIVFLLYHIDLLRLYDVSFSELLNVFAYSLKLDISTAAYILIFPFLLLSVQSFYNHKILNTLNLVYTIIIIIIYSLISFGDIGIYRDWQSKLSYKALLFLSYPKEIVDSVPVFRFILLAAGLIISIFFLIYSYKKWFFKRILEIKRNILFSLIFIVSTPVILLISVRGGLQQIPINQSEAYFSNKQILNIAAVNSGWNLLYSITHNISNINKNPFAVFNEDYADKIVNQIYKKADEDSVLMILKTKTPDIVMFILEGWSADVVESLGGFEDITPNFNKIEKEGILFTDFYSSGQRSQQGMASIFGGFPSHPVDVVTHHQEKYSKLPSFVEKLKETGYTTSFYFGGQLIYGNIKSYLISSGFEKLIEGKDFPSSIHRGKLGVHDAFTLKRQFDDLKNEKHPFFSVLFTLSTHTPYDYPAPKQIKKFDIENDYMDAVHYSDMYLGKFYEAAKKEKCFENTLFIFISDHSHGTPRQHDIYSPEYHKIVFLLAGPVIKPEYQGLKISHIGSQVDFSATVLPQLGIDATDFKWSKNLLNPKSPAFAFYAYEEGFGWVRPYGYSVYESRFDILHHFKIDSSFIDKKDSLTIEGKSYLQKVFQEYMNL